MFNCIELHLISWLHVFEDILGKWLDWSKFIELHDFCEIRIFHLIHHPKISFWLHQCILAIFGTMCYFWKVCHLDASLGIRVPCMIHIYFYIWLMLELPIPICRINQERGAHKCSKSLTLKLSMVWNFSKERIIHEDHDKKKESTSAQDMQWIWFILSQSGVPHESHTCKGRPMYGIFHYVQGSWIVGKLSHAYHVGISWDNLGLYKERIALQGIQ